MVKLYNDYPSCDDKAKRLFEEIKENIYKGNVGLVGKQDTDYRCCCKYEQGKDAASQACGEFAGCVNRELFMECRDGDCATGKYCQNRRFQRAENAKVDVIHFALKGYGLRAMEPLRPNQFIMEYVGEVIKYSAFLKRMTTYNKQGLKHFYFMSLQAGEIIDATKFGCIARFMNHSCNPNCYIQKWMIGDRYRIGIFALRNVRENEELTFDYNADRYGSQAQKCHCGETNCRGVIGGTKETNLNIKDEAEIEAELTEPIRNVDEVKQFINLMYKSLEQPSMVRPILYRLKLTEDVAILRMFMKLFGGIMLKSYLYEFRNDDEIVFKTLNIADKIPFKYTDRRVETSHLKEWVTKFESRNDRIGAKARDLIDKWDKLPSCGPELNELLKQDVNHTLDLADDDEVQIETPSARTNRDRESFNQNKDDLKGKPFERNNFGHANYTNNSGFANNSSDRSKIPQDLNPNRYESSHDFYNRYMDSNAIFQSISQFEYWCKKLGCKVPAPDYYDGIVKMRPDNPYGCTYAPRPTFSMNYVSNYRPRLGISRRFGKPRNHSIATKTSSSEEQKDQSQEQLEPLAPNWSETKDEYGQVYYYNKYTLQTAWERPVVKDDSKSYDGFSQAALQAIIERAEAMAREAEKQRERAAREKAEAEEKAALEAAHGVPLNNPMNEKEFKMAIYKLVINYCSRFKHHFNEIDFKGFSREIGKSIQKKELRRDKWVGVASYMVTENMRSHIKESVIDYMQKAVTLTEKRAEEKKRKREEDDGQVAQKSPKA